MFFEYAIKSLEHDYIYVGLTNSIERRFQSHNRGYNFSTKPYAPFKLIYTKAFPTRPEARIHEKYLKSTLLSPTHTIYAVPKNSRNHGNQENHGSDHIRMPAPRLEALSKYQRLCCPNEFRKSRKSRKLRFRPHKRMPAPRLEGLSQYQSLFCPNEFRKSRKSRKSWFRPHKNACPKT